MCGRYTLTRPDQALLRRFDLFDLPELAPRFNIAPTQLAPIVRRKKGEAAGSAHARELVLAQFGLIPSWVQDPASAPKMINARVEGVAEKPAYRDAFARRRCLVPADGFFEWKRLDGKRKQPYWIHLADRELFAFAGLWERWYDPTGRRIESFAILTCPPSSSIAELHDRMPVILPPESYGEWLDPGIQSPEALGSFLQPFPAQKLRLEPVSTRVNDPTHDDPECLAPPQPEEPPKQGSLF
ncbi:MAG: SOS response-associated peptidase [Deltaproteobacteria bacterium]|nr:SOS response-associated peptidase [Deltaproteobacteria bacterium]